MLDKRLIKVGLQLEEDMLYYSNLDMGIELHGKKSTNVTQNSCEVSIANIAPQLRTYLLDTFNRVNVMTVQLGRESTGLFDVFTGDIVESSITQPPNIILSITANTQANAQYKWKSEYSQSILASDIARNIASGMGLTLTFRASDKRVSNYSFNGPAIAESKKLEELGYKTYINDKELVVQNKGEPLEGRIQILNKNSGMVGVPQLKRIGIGDQSFDGVEVTYLISSETVVGGMIRIESELNPAANGDYYVESLEYAASSNSEVFFYTVSGIRI